MEKDYKLTNHKDIWTKFCFLDESGSLSNPADILFTIGIIKCSQPYYLQSKIHYERDKRNFYDEMKFNKLSKNNFEFAKYMLDCLFATKSLNFYSYTVDKKGEYFINNFGSNMWKAYEDISIKLIKAALPPNEILILIADYITTPNDVKFEVNVKRRINENQSRLAMAGVCRFDSKSNDLLQLTDIIIGSINYDIKLSLGLIKNGNRYKKELVEYFKNRLGIGATDFLEKSFKSSTFNIYIDQNVKKERL